MIKELIRPCPLSYKEKGYNLHSNNYCQIQFPTPLRRGAWGEVLNPCGALLVFTPNVSLLEFIPHLMRGRNDKVDNIDIQIRNS